jgi:hypothetical protein
MEHGLRVFENKVLKRIFILNREEVTGGLRRFHNKELHNLYSSPNIRVITSRRMKWVWNIACMGEMRNTYRILVRKPEGKRPLGRPRCRWEDTIKMNCKEIGYKVMDWIHQAQDRDQWWVLVNMLVTLYVS